MLLTRGVRDEGDECDESFPECTALQGITRSFVIIWDYRYKNRSNFRVSRPPKLWKAGKVQRTHWRTALLTGSPMFFQGQVSKMFTFGNIQVVIVACSLPCYQYCTLDIISYHPQQNQYTHIYIYVYILHIHTKGVGMGVLHLVHPFARGLVSDGQDVVLLPDVSVSRATRRMQCDATGQYPTVSVHGNIEYLHIITY